MRICNETADIEKYVHIWLLPTEHHYYKNKRKGNCANNTASLYLLPYTASLFFDSSIILN